MLWGEMDREPGPQSTALVLAVVALQGAATMCREVVHDEMDCSRLGVSTRDLTKHFGEFAPCAGRRDFGDVLAGEWFDGDKYIGRSLAHILVVNMRVFPTLDPCALALLSMQRNRSFIKAYDWFVS